MKYTELTEQAKQSALDYFACRVFTESYEWEHVYSDVAEIADIIGISIDDRPVKVMSGKTIYEPCIYFSGFYNQGDGASFAGSYRYKVGALKAIKAYTPKDTELHRIVKALQDIQSKNFYRLHATITQSGMYCHSNTMSASVFDYENELRDIGESESDIERALCDFADWIYSQLENEYEFQCKRETIEENIEANDYDFNERGELL